MTVISGSIKSIATSVGTYTKGSISPVFTSSNHDTVKIWRRIVLKLLNYVYLVEILLISSVVVEAVVVVDMAFVDISFVVAIDLNR